MSSTRYLQRLDCRLILSMQLRKHPVMAFWGYTRWPPIWIEYQGTSESILQGEIGVLRSALIYPYNPRKIFLTIKHERADYIDCLLMEYEFLGKYMASLLNDCIGMTIESIGSLKIPITFETDKKFHTAVEQSSGFNILPNICGRKVLPTFRKSVGIGNLTRTLWKLV